MPIFKTDSPQKKLDAARANRDSLVERRKAADASASEHRERARQAAREGADDAALAKIEAAMRMQQDRMQTLAAAISDVEADIATTEREIAKAADEKTRAATAASIDALVERWEKDQVAFVTAAAALEATSREVALLVLDAHGTTSFLMSSGQQLPPAGAVILQGLRAYRDDVLAGRQRATLPQGPPEPVQLKIVKPNTRTIFATTMPIDDDGGES